MKLTTIAFIFSAILILLQSNVPVQAQVSQLAFTDFADAFEMPDGLTTDAQGNLYVLFETPRTAELAQLSPNGALLDQERFGSGLFDRARFIGSRLDLDPDLSLNTVAMVTSDGELIRINQTSDGFRTEPWSVIQPGEVITDNVYDVHLGQTVPFSLSADTTYGDVALFRSAVLPSQLTLYVTGRSQNAREPSQLLRRPFVMRLVADAELGIISAEIVFTSSAETLITEGTTSGIAVNKQGAVLTTLPIQSPNAVIPGEVIDVAVMFTDVTVLNAAIAPAMMEPVFLFDFLDLPSQGMTVDTAGNFYIATNEIGSSACEPDRSGALVVIPVDSLTGRPLLQPDDPTAAAPAPAGTLNQPTCFPIATLTEPTVNSRDVAVSPIDHSVYVTLNILNRIVRAPALIPISSLTTAPGSNPN